MWNFGETTEMVVRSMVERLGSFCWQARMATLRGAGKTAPDDVLRSIQATHARQVAAQQEAASEPDEAPSEAITIWRRPLHHAAFTAASAQPSLLVPQHCGDLLRFTVPFAGPLIFGGEHMLGSTNRARLTLSAEARRLLLPAQAASLSVPPQAQRIYRGHQQQIVATMFTADATALLTVDLAGLIALWPLSDDCAALLGWFEPMRTATVATAFTARLLRGPASWAPDDQRKESLEATVTLDSETGQGNKARIPANSTDCSVHRVFSHLVNSCTKISGSSLCRHC